MLALQLGAGQPLTLARHWLMIWICLLAFDMYGCDVSSSCIIIVLFHQITAVIHGLSDHECIRHCIFSIARNRKPGWCKDQCQVVQCRTIHNALLRCTSTTMLRTAVLSCASIDAARRRTAHHRHYVCSPCPAPRTHTHDAEQHTIAQHVYSHHRASTRCAAAGRANQPKVFDLPNSLEESVRTAAQQCGTSTRHGPRRWSKLHRLSWRSWHQSSGARRKRYPASVLTTVALFHIHTGLQTCHPSYAGRGDSCSRRLTHGAG